MKKIYLLLLILFSFAEMKCQGCIMSYAYDSTTTTYDFAVNPSSNNSIFRWDFGDSTGIHTTGNIATHIFANLGTYMVCVTEFDTLLQTNVNSCCNTIYYNGTQGCSFSAVTGTNLVINFYASTSAAATVTWDFGDGQVGTGFAYSHQYSAPGIYTVCMTSSGLLGSCTSCQVVTVPPMLTCTLTSYTDSSNSSMEHFNFTPTNAGNTFVWNFGDGATASGTTNPTHVYGANGVFTACVEETDTSGAVVCQTCVAVTIGISQSCSFTFTPTAFNAYSILFTTSYDSSLVIPVWDFGDGISYTGGNVETHVYSSPGTYNVCMNLIDIITQAPVCSYCTPVTIAGQQACAANFTTVPYGLDAYFIDYSSANPAATTYIWNFGDGSPANTSRFPVHTYGIPGTYNVCLSIMNSTCADTICQTIIVDSTIIAPVTCTSYFIFTQLSPYQLAVVNLSSGTNLSFSWDFGDGGTSTAAYPIHNYTTTGTFLICLTVADGLLGCTNTYCDSLTVDANGMITYRSSTVGFTINVVSPTQLNTVSIDENNSSLISSLYPNPSKDRIFVSSPSKYGATKYSILSISSQLIKEGKISAEKTEVDISDLSPGIYFLEIRNSLGENSFARFIKN